MKQDGKEFSPASEAMLQQAADGELVLWAFVRRHTAKLRAFPWAAPTPTPRPISTPTPRLATRSCAAGLVPIMPELANELLGFPSAMLKNYLATDPSDCPDSHPWKDHYWVLDEPREVTLEQVYFQGVTVVSAGNDPASDLPQSKATPVGNDGASGAIHSTKSRRDTLTPVIELAQKNCRNPQDTAEVWAALLVLAEKKIAPLIGATEEGLQYLKAGTAEIFARDALRKRLAR